MRTLVTGVAGFVGSTLAESLIDRGDEVIGVDAFTPYYDRIAKDDNVSDLRNRNAFELVEGDLREMSIEALLDGVDTVFHIAAQAGVRLSWSDGFGDYVGHNVLATQRLLEAVVAARPQARVIYASSSSIYGNQARYPVGENALPRPYSPYGVTKLAGEHLCGLYAENRKIQTVSLRYFTVYGPRQRPDMSIHRLCECALHGNAFPRYGDGSQIREFTYVDDIVRGTVLAADTDVAPGSAFNLSGGSEITLTGLINLVGELNEVPVKIDEQPAQAGDAFRNGGAIDHARAYLGWEPAVVLRDGIVKQLAWHRDRLS